MNDLWQDKEKRKVLLASVGLVLGLMLLMLQMGVFSGGGDEGEVEDSGVVDPVAGQLPSTDPASQLPGTAGAATVPSYGPAGPYGPGGGSPYGPTPGAMAVDPSATGAATEGSTDMSLAAAKKAIATAKAPRPPHRSDPFSPLVKPPPPPAPVTAVASLLPDLSIWRPKQRGPRQIDASGAPGGAATMTADAAGATGAEPVRRMVGLMTNNNRAFAILEQDGAQAVVWPGAVLPDRRTRVERIEPDRLALRDTQTGRLQFVPLEYSSTASTATPGTPYGGPAGPYGPSGYRSNVPGGYGPRSGGAVPPGYGPRPGPAVPR